MSLRFHVDAWNLLMAVSAILLIAVMAAIFTLLTR
jgi:hypothetical protein